jgi:hypothetical protein
VKKVRLVISGNEWELYLDKLADGGDDGGNGGGAANAGGAGQAVNEREQMQAIYSQITSLRQTQEANTMLQGHLEVGMTRDNRVMLANLHQLARQSMVQYAPPPTEAEEEDDDGGG